MRSFGIHPVKNAPFQQETLNQYYFLIVIISVPGYAIFSEILVKVINHDHIIELHLFWDSYEWFCLQISSDTKYFFTLVQRILMKD